MNVGVTSLCNVFYSKMSIVPCSARSEYMYSTHTIHPWKEGLEPDPTSFGLPPPSFDMPEPHKVGRTPALLKAFHRAPSVLTTKAGTAGLMVVK